jgi:hypothetical protein
VRDDGLASQHAVRAFRRCQTAGSSEVEAPQRRERRYGATIKDAMTALGGVGSGVRQAAQGDGLTLLPAHGRLRLGQADRGRVLARDQ